MLRNLDDAPRDAKRHRPRSAAAPPRARRLQWRAEGLSIQQIIERAFTPLRRSISVAHMSTRPLRIIHTTSSLKGGGMEHFVLRLAGAQRQLGHDARILALQGGPLEEHAARLGIPTIVLGGSGTGSRVLRGAAAMARLRPSVMHSHNPTSLQYGVLGKLVSGARLVFTDHRGIVRVPQTI
jgi:hypothetical protein